MKEVLQLCGLSLVMFLVGLLCGINADIGNRYLAGELSACNKVVKMDPILQIANVTCVPHEGQVALQVGDKLYSLDGKQLN
jgi:hypothetical protein